MNKIITDILDNKRAELAAKKQVFSETAIRGVAEGESRQVFPPRKLSAALRRPGGASSAGSRIIAEVKRASPMKMLVPVKFDPVALAMDYERSGAAAISVLTDSRYFAGADVFLSMIGNRVGIPLLRKEFMLEPYQVYESRLLGADAILLMTSVISDDKLLAEMNMIAESLGMESLFEVRSEPEIDRAMRAGAKIVGINNRDFMSDNLDVDITVSARLAPKIPAGVVSVSESGIAGRKEIINLESAGIDAFLIGSSLVTDPEPGRKLAGLIGGS